MEQCIRYEFTRRTMTLEWEAPQVARRANVTPEQYARLCELTDELGLKSWDGFSGTDSGVLDGEGFSVHIDFAGGEKARASGYMCFPKGYREAKRKMFSFFETVLKDAPMKSNKN